MSPQTATQQYPESMRLPLSGTCVIPAILSVIAGSADVISFLGFGMFTAHITGNLVILAAHVVAGQAADLGLILSVPIFIAVLCLMRLLVAGLEAVHIHSLRPLLMLQLVLLGGAFVCCGASSQPLNQTAISTVVGSELAVAAMAVQAALVQLSLKGVPSTAVMTTNVTRFVMDIGDVLLGGPPADRFQARRRAQHTWPVILGFTIGAGLGAASFAIVGLKSLGLPVGLALLVLIVSFTANPDAERPPQK